MCVNAITHLDLIDQHYDCMFSRIFYLTSRQVMKVIAIQDIRTAPFLKGPFGQGGGGSCGVCTHTQTQFEQLTETTASSLKNTKIN